MLVALICHLVVSELLFDLAARAGPIPTLKVSVLAVQYFSSSASHRAIAVQVDRVRLDPCSSPVDSFSFLVVAGHSSLP